MYLCYITGNYEASKNTYILSAPIFMDNVACYGSESKLVDCTYNTDTTEDKHSEDIWINCGTTDTTTTDNSTPASTIVLVVLFSIMSVIGIIVIGLLIGCLVYKHKNKKESDAR